MRKDVKFGLTIGAILVVTLVAYVIVLTRGDKQPNVQEVKLEIPAPAAPTKTDAGTPATPSHIDAPAPDLAHDTHVDSTSTGSTPPTPPTVPAPTTDPSPVARVFDWSQGLANGPDHLFAQADTTHTVTPTAGDAAGGNQVTDSGNLHPTIDTPTHQGDVQASVVTPPAPPVVDPPATPSAVAGSTGTAVRSHKVASGETLSIIAKAVYGNAKYWGKILEANPGINPKNLKIGTNLIIPDLSSFTANSTASDHGADLPTPTPTPGETAADSAPIDPATSYKVVSGDSLEKIALKLYGKAEMKEKLYDSNKSLIGPDEDRLKIGWILKLPQAPTANATASR